MSATELRNIEEQSLWNAFLQGDDSSLETLYRRYFDELYSYGKKWQNNPTSAEDCIQDLFMKLMRNRANLSTPVSVKYYLFRSLRSVIMDKLKQKRIIRYVDEPGDQLFVFDLCPEQQLMAEEEYEQWQQKLNLALNALTARQRDAVYLRYIEGFSYKEVSEMLALTPKGTYKLVARAIEALKEQLIGLLLICAASIFSLLFH